MAGLAWELCSGGFYLLGDVRCISVSYEQSKEITQNVDNTYVDVDMYSLPWRPRSWTRLGLAIRTRAWKVSLCVGVSP